MNKTSFYILAMFVVLAGIVFFAESPERILGTPEAIQNQGDAIPFAVAQGTKTLYYNEDGKLSYSFNAERLEHYRNEDSDNNVIEEVFTLIDKPQLVFYQGNEPWFVTSVQGKIITDDEKIELWNQVFVRHTSEEGVITKIETEKLNIDPISKFAKTDEPVKISSDQVEITGEGMTADFNAQKLKLLSKVHGFYDPT